MDEAKAKQLVTFKTGKLDSNAAEDGGKYPFFTCANETFAINTFAFDTECILLAGNNAGGIFPLKYFRGKFNAYQRTYVIETKNPKRLNLKYFYFFLRPMLRAFEQQATGATTKFLTKSILNNIGVLLPDIKSQRKIAAVLSGYDDLIENNKRRIAILGKMAEEIYREWFVRMRFPGHETTKVEKGVPNGWTVAGLETLCVEVRKRTKKKDLSEDLLYVGLEHMPRRSIALTEFGFADSVQSDKFTFIDNDILFGKIRPYLHKIALAPFAGTCSSDIIVVRSLEPHSLAFVLFTVFSEAFVDLATVASKGTKMPRADWDFLKKQEMRIPSSELLGEFQEKIDPIFDQIRAVTEINRLSAQAKNLLLPRLISGKLSVEELDIQFPPSMIEEEQSEPEAAYA